MHLKRVFILIGLAIGGHARVGKNEPCGSNVQCEGACQDREYHVVSTQNASFFACSKAQLLKYSLYECNSIYGRRMDNATAICEAASGEDCFYCIVLEDNRQTWKDTCKEAGGVISDVYDRNPVDYETVVEKAACNQK
jgi:hypothetical protein